MINIEPVQMLWRKKHPHFNSHAHKPPLKGDPYYDAKMFVYENWLNGQTPLAQHEMHLVNLTDEEKNAYFYDLGIGNNKDAKLVHAKNALDENDRPKHIPTSEEYIKRHVVLDEYWQERSGLTINGTVSPFKKDYYWALFHAAEPYLVNLAENDVPLEAAKQFLDTYATKALLHMKELGIGTAYPGPDIHSRIKQFERGQPGLIRTVAREMAIELEHHHTLSETPLAQVQGPKNMEKLSAPEISTPLALEEKNHADEMPSFVNRVEDGNYASWGAPAKSNRL